MINSYCIKKKEKTKGREPSSVIPTPLSAGSTPVGIQTYSRIALINFRLHGDDLKDVTVRGQSFTEFLIIFPVLLLMISSLIFFARLLVLKQRTVTAVRYTAWYAGRHDGNEPSANVLKNLFFNKNSTVSIRHPDPRIGFACNSLGDLGNVLEQVAGINGTAIDVTGCNYPFSSKFAHTGAQHFVFMDTWKDSGITGKALKYGLWAIAVGKAFQGSSTHIDLENPSITGN
jgi:hypothetical protein